MAMKSVEWCMERSGWRALGNENVFTLSLSWQEERKSCVCVCLLCATKEAVLYVLETECHRHSAHVWLVSRVCYSPTTTSSSSLSRRLVGRHEQFMSTQIGLVRHKHTQTQWKGMGKTMKMKMKWYLQSNPMDRTLTHTQQQQHKRR